MTASFLGKLHIIYPCISLCWRGKKRGGNFLKRERWGTDVLVSLTTKPGFSLPPNTFLSMLLNHLFFDLPLDFFPVLLTLYTHLTRWDENCSCTIYGQITATDSNTSSSAWSGGQAALDNTYYVCTSCTTTDQNFWNLCFQIMPLLLYITVSIS